MAHVCVSCIGWLHCNYYLLINNFRLDNGRQMKWNDTDNVLWLTVIVSPCMQLQLVVIMRYIKIISHAWSSEMGYGLGYLDSSSAMLCLVSKTPAEWAMPLNLFPSMASFKASLRAGWGRRLYQIRTAGSPRYSNMIDYSVQKCNLVAS